MPCNKTFEQMFNDDDGTRIKVKQYFSIIVNPLDLLASKERIRRQCEKELWRIEHNIEE